MKNLFVLVVLSLVFTPLISHAADEAPPVQDNPFVSAVKEFSKDLSKEDERHFNTLYGNYNILQIVESVKEMLGDTVDACGDANPEMEEDLDRRYEGWLEAVEPVIDEAEGQIDNMVMVQDYAEPAKIRSLFKLLRETRAGADQTMEKVPVTTKEACQYALDKMDETQVNFTQLLRQTLITLPRQMQEEDDEAEAEQDAQDGAEADEPIPDV